MMPLSAPDSSWMWLHCSQLQCLWAGPQVFPDILVSPFCKMAVPLLVRHFVPPFWGQETLQRFHSLLKGGRML